MGFRAHKQVHFFLSRKRAVPRRDCFEFQCALVVASSQLISKGEYVVRVIGSGCDRDPARR